MKRTLILLLAFVMLMGMMPSQSIPVTASAASNVITNSQIEAAIAWAENYLSPTDSSVFYGLCAAFVFHAYNEGAGIANSSYSTATAMGNALITNTDSNPPRGAFVFWYIPDVPAGHVALSLGNGKIIHAWGSKPKCVVSGTVANVTNYYGASNYRGWGSPISGYKLATDTGTTAPYTTGVSHSGITTDNVVLKATWSNPSKITLKYGGFTVKNSAGTVVATTKDTVPSSYQTAASLPCSYDLKNEYGKTLSSGTQYIYSFYVIDSSGNTYTSAEYTFTTTAIPVTGVTVSPSSKALNIGSTVQLSASVSPSNASNKNVTWSSSNTAVATVSASGLVTAKAVGSATIYATAADGSGKSGSATISVSCSHSSYTILPAVSPTCTQTGLTEGRRCNTCGVTTVPQTTVSATGHNYVEGTVQPSCTEQGHVFFSCTKCGDSYNDSTIAALGHNWGGWSVSIEATATTNGEKIRTCGTCGETETDIIPATGNIEPTTPSEVYSGTCGENLTWTLDSEGTLTISGTGAMEDFTVAPWATYCDDILSLYIEPGVTTIGTNAFYGCLSLTEITIPDSVSKIGDWTLPMCYIHPDVYYSGNKNQWDAIDIGTHNDALLYANIHCNGETKPTDPKPTTPPEEDNKPATNPFVDVPSDAFYHDPVLWAVDNTITNGIDATHFGPDAGCTRAHVVTFLWRAAGSPAPSSSYNPFTDVLPGAYYYDAVLWAVEEGITNGTSATTFAPDQTCTRGQIVTFLWRYQHSPSAAGMTSFNDVPAGQYYSTAVAWAVENAITNGMGEGIFAPDATCTRGQIVTFLYRAMA